MKNNKSLIDYMLLLGISVIWGSQFFFSALALQYFPPIIIAFLRVCIGVATLSFFLLFCQKSKKPNLRNYLLFFIIGFFEATLPFFLILWGQQHTSSNITSILIATIPLFTIGIIYIFIDHNSISRYQFIAIIIGFFAVFILLSAKINFSNSIICNFSDLLGELSILMGAMSFAISIILIQQISHLSSINSARNILLSSCLQLLPFALFSMFFMNNWQFHYNFISLLSVLLLGIFATGIVYVMYVILIKRSGPTFASLNNYFIPIIGILLGNFILKEHMNLQILFALLILIIAMIINNY